MPIYFCDTFTAYRIFGIEVNKSVMLYQSIETGSDRIVKNKRLRTKFMANLEPDIKASLSFQMKKTARPTQKGERERKKAAHT